MNNQTSQKGSYNISVQSVERDGTVNIMQSVIVNNADYEKSKTDLEREKKYFSKLEEGEVDERLKTSERISYLEKEMAQYEDYFVTISRELERTKDLNSKRLNEVRTLFGKGEIDKAREYYSSKKNELFEDEKLLDRRKEIIAEEFFLLALLTQTEYSSPDWFSLTCEYFEKSIKNNSILVNNWRYAFFLEQHNQWEKAANLFGNILQQFHDTIRKIDRAAILNSLGAIHRLAGEFELALCEFKEAETILRALANEGDSRSLQTLSYVLNNLGTLFDTQNQYSDALPCYFESLKIRRGLAKISSETYLPDVAGVLQNLAIIHQKQILYDESLKEYQESLSIRRDFALSNPSKYLPEVAQTLNNLGLLFTDREEIDVSLECYDEALTIRRKLAGVNHQKYISDVAQTSNNIAISYTKQEKYDLALTQYKEAKNIWSNLAAEYPQIYLPKLAKVLHNMATLFCVQDMFDEAIDAYQETLSIRRKLITENSEAYTPDLISTLLNLANFYCSCKPNREKALENVVEAIALLLPITEKIPYTKQYLEVGFAILKAWGIDKEAALNIIQSNHTTGTQ